jgi:ribosome recycling factor
MKLDQLVKKVEPKMEEATVFVEEELKQIRAGQASAGLVEDLPVDYYGSQVTLKELATITTPNPQTIFIQPYDQKAKEQIVLAIQNSELNLTANDDGQRLILNLPTLSAERREELIKVVKDKVEQGKVSIRNAREDVWNEIQKLEQQGKLTEDDRYRGKDELDKLAEEYNNKIDQLAQEKEEALRKI